MKTATPRTDAELERMRKVRGLSCDLVDGTFARQLESELNDLLKTAGIVAAWLERSRQINPSDMVARNIELAKELRLAAHPQI